MDHSSGTSQNNNEISLTKDKRHRYVQSIRMTIIQDESRVEIADKSD